MSAIGLAILLFPGFFFPLVLSADASAQVLYGTLVGNITDATGSVIPGAAVTIANTLTNEKRETAATDAGTYTFSNLQPGIYTMSVAVPGFKQFVRTEIQVKVNSIARADAALEVGARSETVTVSAKSGMLQTDKSDVHKELDSLEIANLPLGAYRNYQALVNLVPGSTPSAFQNSSVDTPARSLTTNINGVARFNNNTRLDGALNILPWLPQHSAYVAPQESIQAVSISTNSFDAEQGFAGGAAITVQTKSGTNAYHGVVFDYLRNSAFDARNFFTPRNSGAPKYILSMFGGNLGGPAVKDRLFFFANYDGMRERQSYARYFTIPTREMKQGNFNATGTSIHDPATGDQTNGRSRTVFGGGIIPATRISSAARTILGLMPDPNIEGTFVNNYYASAPRVFDRDMYDFKVDWIRSATSTIWLKYSLMNSLVESRYAFGEAGGDALSPDGGAGKGTVRVHVGTLGGYYAVTPRFLVDGTIGVTRYVHHVRQPDFGTNYGLEVLKIPGTNGPDPRQSGKPLFALTGYASMGSVDIWVPADRWDYTYTFTANASWSKGKHDIRFGPDVSRFGMNHWQPELGNGPRGAFTFTGGATALNGGPPPNRFNSMADFLLGLPQRVQKTLQYYDPMSTREWQVALYIRDRWQATRNLTLNLGLRWEYFPIVDRGFHGIERYDPGTNKMLIGGYGGVDWSADTTVSKKLFAPRIGIAYRLGRQGVVRTGYGITYDPYNLGRPMRSPYPAVIQLALSGPNSYIPYGPILNGIPPVVGPDYRTGVIEIPGNISTRSLPRGLFRRGYVQSWNVAYERPLFLNLVCSVGYVGTHSINIVSGQTYPLNNAAVGTGQAGRPLNQKFGRTAPTDILQPYNYAYYHSLQASLERRLSRGFQLKTVYTWSHSIDDNSLVVGIPELFWRNRGASDFDRRHIFRAAWMYEMPWGPGQRWSKSGLMAAIIGSWRINGIVSSATGAPFTAISSSASLNAPDSGQFADQVLPEVRKLGKIGTGAPFFDPLAFRPVTAVRFGNSGRNSLYGPGRANVDISAFRTFKIAEGKELQFRAESSNFTNTPHFNNPSPNASEMTFNPDGTLRSSGNFMSISSARPDQRTFRFGLRFSF